MPRIALVLCLVAASVLGCPLIAQQGPAQDDQILERADKILDEAKSAYEAAREKSSVEAFVNAGFKLEEARIKYFVLQEIGSPEKQKIAADRLRSVNQLSKLIHDGKVAIGGKPAEVPAAPPPSPSKPADPAAPAAPAPEPAPAAAAVDVTRRARIPDAAKQKDAEKALRDLYKDQYAKKATGDRQALARLLLGQARKSTDDPASLWVLYREAQDVALPVCDVWTAIAAIEESSKFFDVDPLAAKVSAVTAMGKSARAPEDFMALAEVMDPLAVDLMSADQYDAAEKVASTALQYAKKINAARLLPRATARSKEVAEAKGKFQAMKSVLQTLARTPDDPGANAEMGQFLCFIKGNWDLGLRFLVKGSDAALKALSEKELALPTAVADQIAVADGWYDLGDKEKLPLRKAQLLAHAREYYTAASSGAVGLQKPKLEKRLELIEAAIGAPAVEAGTVNLFKLIDLKKDVIGGEWFAKGGGYQSKSGFGAKLQIPYAVPAEYDLLFTVERQADECMLFGLVSETGPFTAVINPGWRAGFELLEGKGYGEQTDATTTPGPPVPIGRPSVLRFSVRRGWVKFFIDGKQILAWEGGMKKLTPNGAWGANPKCPFIGTFNGNVVYTGITIVPVLDPGKPLR